MEQTDGGVELTPDAPAEPRDDVASESVEATAADAPRRKWHDRTWLRVTTVSLVAMLIGVGIAAPDRQAAKDEAAKILAAAEKDAADVERDAQDDAEATVADAQEEREELLSGVEQEKADLTESIASAQTDLAAVKDSVRTARRDLSSTERSRVKKQKQVDQLNRAIRSSTTLSRENAVAKARDYLEYSSFSCQGLIQQLSSEYGEKFSVSDATHAAKQVGLC